MSNFAVVSNFHMAGKGQTQSFFVRTDWYVGLLDLFKEAKCIILLAAIMWIAIYWR